MIPTLVLQTHSVIKSIQVKIPGYVLWIVYIVRLSRMFRNY